MELKMIPTTATGTRNNYNSIVTSINTYRKHTRDYLEQKKKEEEEAAKISESIVNEVKSRVNRVLKNSSVTKQIVNGFWSLY